MKNGKEWTEKRIAVISAKKTPSNKPSNVIWLELKDDSMEDMFRTARRMRPDEVYFDTNGMLWRPTEWTEDSSFSDRYAVQLFGSESVYCTDPQTGEMLTFNTWEDAADFAADESRKSLRLIADLSDAENSRGYYTRRLKEIGDHLTGYYDKHPVPEKNERLNERIDFYLNRNSAEAGELPYSIRSAMRKALFCFIRSGKELTLPESLFSAGTETPEILKQPGTDREIDQVGIRLVRERTIYSDTPIRNQEDVVNLLGRELSSYDREVVALIHLDTAGHPLSVSVVSMGTLNTSLVSPREVLKSVVLSNTAAVIMLHNHPSGSAEPSQTDYAITNRLSAIFQLMDVPLRDHIVVAPDQSFHGFHYYSLLEHGEMPGEAAKFQISQGRITWEEESSKGLRMAR